MTYTHIRITKSMALVAGIGLMIAGLALLPFIGKAQSPATISQELDFGEQGVDVSRLQTFLATESLIYPQGLVTGYFGPLTQAAVKQFQIAYNISPAGRVGPLTLAKINGLIVSGKNIDVKAPILSSVTVSPSGSQGMSFAWTTNEPATSKVFYDNKPLIGYEVDKPFTEPYTSGTVAFQPTLQTSQYIVLGNLSRNTTYYYSVESVDAAGNVSLTPPSTFKIQ